MKASVWFLTLLTGLTACIGSRQSGKTTQPRGYEQRVSAYQDRRAANGRATNGRAANGRSAEPGVQVLDIDLTPEYTILYMTFVDQDRLAYQNGQKPTITIEPAGRLVAANGARSFRFIKAEGIPVKPEKLATGPGDRVDFVLYFERLDSGLEYFDLYQCSDTDQAICWNIYDLYVQNPADAPDSRPLEPVSTRLTIDGTVRDSRTGQPVAAGIDYQSSAGREPIAVVQSDEGTGTYRLTLDRGRVYTYVASARGYRAGSGTLELSRATPGQTITRDILMTPLVIGDKVELKNVYFEMSKSDLLSASFAELDQVAAMMQDNPNLKIRLEGHTDIVGDHDKNRQLSKDRVWACRDYLTKQGIDRDRIEAVGYGDTRPLLTRGSDEERRVNRRVEFVILTL